MEKSVASLEQIKELIRFCNRQPYALPCVVFDVLGGHFVKV